MTLHTSDELVRCNPDFGRRTWIGDVFPVTSLKQVQETLWVDAEWSYWDKDDYSELFYVRMASAEDFTRGGIPACMDPKGLPEHLQPLVVRIADDLSTRECEKIGMTVYEYAHVFWSPAAFI